MDAHSSLNLSNHSKVRLDDDEISSSPPTSSSTATSATVLNKARNTRIKNSLFSATTNTTNNSTINYNTNNDSSAPSSLDSLYKFAAPNAILNAGGRADEVRCYPGTREEVIGLVEKSINAQVYSGPRMLWLSGPAGAGKSAIMQTVAERCEQQGVPQANFFFFRGDSSRSDASPLVATLMHQIIKLYPSIRPAVAAALASDPLLFQTGLPTQFDALIHRTFPTVQDSPSSLRPLVLLIDGLDECDSQNKTAQRQLLQALDTLLVQKGPYFRVVVSSRVEPQISMAFKQLRSQVDSIFLDEQYSPEKDIRLFVTAEFQKIKSTHSLAHTLGQNWPSDSDMDGIVSKSSGQFIYAATVMRFIMYSPASPVLSLQKVQGIVPPVKNTPFAHLDAIYIYILEQVDDLEAVKCIFSLRLLDTFGMPGIRNLMHFYQPRYSGVVVNSCLSELTSILHQRNRQLTFFHASFPDFLLDKSRARQYHIDLNMFCAAVFPVLWVSNLERKSSSVFRFAVVAFRHIQQPTPEITTALMKVHLDPTVMRRGTYPSSPVMWDPTLSVLNAWVDIAMAGILVDRLHRLYALHDPQPFVEIMHKWTSTEPGLAVLFSRHFPQFAIIESDPKVLPSDPGMPSNNSKVLSVVAQEKPRRKRAMQFVKKGLHHLTGNNKSGK